MLEESGKLLLNFFCQSVENVSAKRLIKAAKTPFKGKLLPISKPRTRLAPANPNIIPIHWGFVIFSLSGVTLDFFLGISVLSVLVSFFWGERRIIFLFLVAIIFPIVVFIFFETILGLRFPGGIITNFYYN